MGGGGIGGLTLISYLKQIEKSNKPIHKEDASNHWSAQLFLNRTISNM